LSVFSAFFQRRFTLPVLPAELLNLGEPFNQQHRGTQATIPATTAVPVMLENRLLRPRNQSMG
jgi:hypothetical protein